MTLHGRPFDLASPRTRPSVMGTPEIGSSIAVSDRSDWTRLALGLIAVYVLFQWSAATLGSDRGQAGLVVAGIVVSGTVLVESLWSRRAITSTLRAVGLGAPRLRGLAVAAGVCGLLLLVVPAFSLATGSAVTTMDGWVWLIPGLFAQAGIAEETLFRGYLFGRLRTGRTFWRAAALSMVPFVAVHLVLFITMPFWVAMAALMLAVVTSFPMAQLFELGGSTIWPPALMHFVVQGTVKVTVLSGEASAAFPLVWMLASAVLPLFVFLVPRPRSMGTTSATA
jgi:membrane protease YdiL (CAAX protease family)